MKKLALVFATVVLFTLLGTHRAHAQAYGYYLTNFQCDPLSCDEAGPDATVSYAEVDFYGTCDLPNGGSFQVSGSPFSAVGFDGPCSSPYTPAVSVWTDSVTLIDSNEQPYNVDYVYDYTQILNPSGTIAYEEDAQAGCDGSYDSGGSGTWPC
jgi:hypothetical protein